MEYHSRVSGKIEYLPMTISLLGPPGKIETYEQAGRCWKYRYRIRYDIDSDNWKVAEKERSANSHFYWPEDVWYHYSLGTEALNCLSVMMF